MNNTTKWTGAIVLSLLAHAGAAKLFEPGEKPPEQAMVAGGEAMEVAVLGNAFEETIQAGDLTETMEPEKVELEEVEPAEVAEVTPVQSAAETPSDIVPTEADVILPAEDIPPVAAEQPEVTATVAPEETVVPEEKPEPVVKPEPEKKPKKEPEKERPEKKKPVRKKAGDEGKSEVAQKKGQADGAEAATADVANGKKGAVSQQSGNANLSNYDGKVRSKLNRAFRYPAQAKREGLQGTAHVRFTVSSSGAASNVSIAKSAGAPILDQAALETVRRASPFPKIPGGAGLSSRTFTIPLQFKR